MTVNDPINLLAADAVQGRYLSTVEIRAGRDVSDFFYISARELRLSVILSTLVEAVYRVASKLVNAVPVLLALRHPLKVFEPVVRAVSVLVVALAAFGSRANERLKNKLVNAAVLLGAVRKRQGGFSVAGPLQATDGPTDGGSLRAPRNADVPEVRHFVSPLEAFNNSPLFAHNASATSLRKGGEVAATGAEIRLFGLQSLAA